MPAWLGSGFNVFRIANVCCLVVFLHVALDLSQKAEKRLFLHIGEQRGKAGKQALLHLL